MREIGIGVIGWGFMGKTHAHVLREMPLFYEGASFRPVIKCICTRREEKAREAARTLGVPAYTTSFRELLSREDIEVVSVSTPNGLHEEMVIQALRAGKNVYVDKPLAMNAREAENIARAVRESGKLLQVANNNRFFPSTLRARELVEAGAIGEILGFSFRYLHSGSIDQNRRVGWKQMDEGGVLLDLGSHAMDLLQYLAGEVESVSASLRALYPERPGADGKPVKNLGDDQMVALVKLKGGAVGTVEATKIWTGAEDELSFEIAGTKGAIRWNLMRPNYLEYYDNTRPERPLGGDRGYTEIASVSRYPLPGGVFLPGKGTVGWDRAHMHCYYSFLRCVAEGGQPHPDAEDALRLQKVLDAVRLSAATGRWETV